MMFKSVYPSLDIPKTNILSYLYPANQTVSDTPVWIDAQDPANSLSPRQMLSWVRRLGVGLDNIRVGRGETVMVLTPNHIFVPVAYQGIVGSGRIFSGASPTFTVAEVQYQLKNTSASAMFVHPSLIQTAVEACRAVGLPKNRIFQFSDRPCSTVDGILDWREIAGSEKEANTWKWDELKETADSTIATINYSSGTTGLPKGVCVSHYNLIANAEQTIFSRDQETDYAAVPGARPAEKWVGLLPLYHAFGKIQSYYKIFETATDKNQVSSMRF
jgi:4-coumarate--CoA ligase